MARGILATIREYLNQRNTIKNFRLAIADACGLEYGISLPIAYRLRGRWGPGFYIDVDDNHCCTSAKDLNDGAEYLYELIERAKKAPLNWTQGWKYKGLWVGMECATMSRVLLWISEKHTEGYADVRRLVKEDAEDEQRCPSPDSAT